MKKILTLLFAATFMFASCEHYDDSALNDRVDNLENRVEKLEELCNQMNTNIGALQTIVNALQENDYITSITPIKDGAETIGYTISFSKSGDVTIYHGKDGKDGVDGENGYTPQIGVKKDADGIYYWTLDGEWLLDAAGNKIKAEGQDGKDGQDGQDGQNGQNGQDGQGGEGSASQPTFKIVDGYWFVSYNGEEWIKLGPATGENGKDGDNMFKEVNVNEDNVEFILSNGTSFVIPLATGDIFSRLQSVTYIPEYTDGKTGVQDQGVGIFNFRISPKEIAAELMKDNAWKKYVSMHAYYTKERTTTAIDFINMPVVSFEAGEDGMIIVSASGKNLNHAFYEGTQNASAELIISDGNIVVASERIELLPLEKAKEPIITPSFLSLGNYENPDQSEAWDGFNLQAAPVIFGYEHSGSQVMYLPEQLSEMKGMEITSISFKAFTFDAYTDGYSSEITAYVQEIDGRQFPYNESEKTYEWIDFDPRTPVDFYTFEEDFMDAAYMNPRDIEITFHFKEPYVYQGKTLIVTVVNDSEMNTDVDCIQFYWIPSQKNDPWKTLVYADYSATFYDKMEYSHLLLTRNNEDKWKNAPIVKFGYNKVEYK